LTYSAEDTRKLESILSKLETVYSPLMASEEYHSDDMEEVVSNVFSYIETLDDKEIHFKLTNEKVVPIIAELSYLMHRTSFYGLQVVIFDNFPDVIPVSRFAFKLTKNIFLGYLELAEYKEFLARLHHIDEERIEHKFGLPYRMLKLMFIMTLYESFAGASVLSKFVLHQIALTAKIDA